MHYSTLIAAAFVALAGASPVKRDLALIQAAFTNVSNAVNKLDTDIQAIDPSGDVPSTIALLQADSDAVVSALDTGAANINASDPITLLDSLGLLSYSNALINATNNTINDLVSKVDIVNANNQAAAVVAALNAQKLSSQGFTAAIQSKVPEQVVSVVQSQGQQVIDIINRGIVAYGGAITEKLRRAWMMASLGEVNI
jgi:hypothetical protein